MDRKLNTTHWPLKNSDLSKFNTKYLGRSIFFNILELSNFNILLTISLLIAVYRWSVLKKQVTRRRVQLSERSQALIVLMPGFTQYEKR